MKIILLAKPRIEISNNNDNLSFTISTYSYIYTFNQKIMIGQTRMVAETDHTLSIGSTISLEQLSYQFHYYNAVE